MHERFVQDFQDMRTLICKHSKVWVGLGDMAKKNIISVFFGRIAIYGIYRWYFRFCIKKNNIYIYTHYIYKTYHPTLSNETIHFKGYETK